MRIIHHFGAFLLLIATALIIVTTISSPVVHDLGILKVDMSGSFRGSKVSFGTFGYCIINVDGKGTDQCSNSVVGYSPANVMHSVDGTVFSDYAASSTSTLTRIMILHPISAGLCFLGVVLAAGSATLGLLAASVMAAVAFVATVVALVCDFVLFSIIRSNVNDNSNTSNNAFFAEGLWTLLVACILCLIASALLLVACCIGTARAATHHSPKQLDREAAVTPVHDGTHRSRWAIR